MLGGGGFLPTLTLRVRLVKVPIPIDLQGQRQINPHESRWFWIVLIANPAVWALFCLSALLGLDWGECSRQGYATPHTYCFTHRTAAACQGVGVNASAGTAYMVNANGLPTSQGYKPYSGCA